MRNEFYIKYLAILPAGLEKMVGEIILDHRGQDMAFPRTRLVAMAASRFPYIRDIDRAVRRAIEKLRVDGWLVGMNHEGDGYFLITTVDEYFEFRSDYTKRADTILKNAIQMDESARRIFGSLEKSPKQLSLIG